MSELSSVFDVTSWSTLTFIRNTTWVFPVELRPAWPAVALVFVEWLVCLSKWSFLGSLMRPTLDLVFTIVPVSWLWKMNRNAQIRSSLVSMAGALPTKEGWEVGFFGGREYYFCILWYVSMRCLKSCTFCVQLVFSKFLYTWSMHYFHKYSWIRTLEAIGTSMRFNEILGVFDRNMSL